MSADVVAPAIRLAVGDVATVYVHYLAEHRAVRFLACSATHCSRLSFGASTSSPPQPQLQQLFTAEAAGAGAAYLGECNKQGLMCTRAHSAVSSLAQSCALVR